MEKEYEWVKVVYRDETHKKIEIKWIKCPLQGNAYVDMEVKNGLAEAMKPRISWKIEDTCMTKPI